MQDITRQAQAVWRGDLKSGSGKITSTSGAFKELPYSVPSRFEGGQGTNPEELLAAAHAGCFSMMLSKLLGDQQKKAESITTKATISMGQRSGAWKIVKVHLETEVRIAGANEADVKRAAEEAKQKCPVSVLLAPGLDELTLQVRVSPV